MGQRHSVGSLHFLDVLGLARAGSHLLEGARLQLGIGNACSHSGGAGYVSSHSVEVATLFLIVGLARGSLDFGSCHW